MLPDWMSIPRLCGLMPPQRDPLPSLPSFQEFNDTISALARTNAPPCRWTPPPSPRYELPHNSAAYNYKNIICFKTMSSSVTNGGAPYTRPSINLSSQTRGIRADRRYTTEETDWILDAVRVRKLTWKQIKEEFSVRFPNDLKRTEQGLQGLYYRKNNSRSVRNLKSRTFALTQRG
ncbi:hypothetical protein FSARC_9120 [Fusarium sarcochroum]|uniref:Uncharacterized protein n=1 Tax=Fusarium sarcochroum TaxID=1208366 RepID=A0A8H4X5M8_9HYPO|nr:hypothetical protein FSARC_9120 [Fusarium sarcochroum]